MILYFLWSLDKYEPQKLLAEYIKIVINITVIVYLTKSTMYMFMDW